MGEKARSREIKRMRKERGGIWVYEGERKSSRAKEEKRGKQLGAKNE